MDIGHPLNQPSQVLLLSAEESDVDPNLSLNHFLRQDACFGFEAGVTSMSVQKFASFGVVVGFSYLRASRILYRFLVLDTF